MDQDYALFLHFENIKNTLYRRLSGGRYNYPNYFYSWFNTDEKNYYNILTLRQKLGKEISDEEIESYNKIRVTKS